MNSCKVCADVNYPVDITWISRRGEVQREERITYTKSTAATSVEDFWTAVSRGWDIEPRSYFELEFAALGFKSAVEMAVHHMWKRHAKEWPK